MASVTKSFQTHGIVPDVVSKAPESLLSVKYPSGVTVSEGKELTPTQVKDIPEVKWDADNNSFYTLIFTDPDNFAAAPPGADPNLREWHHWLVGNIKGSALESGETLSAYIGSGPPEGTGLHRYVFLLYKQSGKINFDEPRLTKTIDKRDAFSTAKFAKKYNLGNPIAGNFYLAQFDNYVPTLYKLLGA